MRFKIIFVPILILTLLFASCWNPFSLVNDAIFKPVTEKPDMTDLIGKYMLDSFSIGFINSLEKYNEQVTSLELLPNGKLILNNVPDIMFKFSEEIQYERLSYTGDWQIGKNIQDSTRYNLKIGINNYSERGGFATSLDLREYKGQIGIWYFIGDPDSGDRFFFIKQSDSAN